MSSFDRESFHLLQVSDSATDSVPDLDLVIPSNNVKKKKVRLKRKERGGRQSAPLRSLNDGWWSWSCSYTPHSSGCYTPSCLLGVLTTSFILILIVMGYLTSTLHSRLLLLEHQLRMKIVDDDSKSIPETLQLLQSKLQTLQNNQSEVQLSLGALNKAVTGLQERLDRVNTSLQREGLTQGGDGQVKQSLADLGVRVSEIRQGLELASNTSSKNSASISMITTELNSIKLNNIDLRNGGGSPKVTPSPSPAEPNPELTRLNDTIKVHNQRLNNLNNTLLSVAQNSTVMIDWVKQDVVALQGKVSQLQDDNQNVSSRLTSLSEKCSSQFMTSLSNISSLQSAVEKLESQMKQLKSADSLLITPNQVLPLSASESPPPAKPPGLAPPLNLQPSTEGQSVGSNLKNTEVEAKKRPRDKRQSSDPGLKP